MAFQSSLEQLASHCQTAHFIIRMSWISEFQSLERSSCCARAIVHANVPQKTQVTAFTFLEVFLNALEALLRVLSMSLVLTCSESGSVHWIKFSWFIKRQQRETQRLKLNTIKHDPKSYIILCCQKRVCLSQTLFISLSLSLSPCLSLQRAC